jgi:D-sedoheptulose 7-phosphate isomerase
MTECRMDVSLLVENHIGAITDSLASLAGSADRLASWGQTLAWRLVAGHRLLAAGNGGSAAEAQHLTAELLGRFDEEREPFSAIALHADSSSITAIGNDYGFQNVFARQVRAHGRPGDVLVLLSTSGHSPNLLAAAEMARECGVTTWAFTGAAPNPLADLVDECIAVDGPPASVQECHLIAVHALCQAFDVTVTELHSQSLTPDPFRPDERAASLGQAERWLA